MRKKSGEEIVGRFSNASQVSGHRRGARLGGGGGQQRGADRVALQDVIPQSLEGGFDPVAQRGLPAEQHPLADGHSALTAKSSRIRYDV